MKWALVGLGLAVVGCGGGTTADDVKPELASIQSEIFAPACATSGCHDARDQAGELDMSTAQLSYDGMVNVKSKNPVAKANGWIMIKPGEPDRSFLMRKLLGPGVGEGDPMPSASQELHPYYVEVIETWIENGAPR